MTPESCTSPTRDALPSRMPFLREPGAVLFWLGNTIGALRAAAAHTITGELSGPDTRQFLLAFFRSEWTALGEEGPGLIPFLADAVAREHSLLAMEYMAYALAVQGPDGVVELRRLTAHADFHVRWKAALALASIDVDGHDDRRANEGPQHSHCIGGMTALSSASKSGVQGTITWLQPGEGPPHTRGQTIVFLPSLDGGGSRKSRE